MAWRSKFPAGEGGVVHRNSCENVSPTVPNPDPVSNQKIPFLVFISFTYSHSRLNSKTRLYVFFENRN